MTVYYKYPRTLHLPFSKHLTTDDKKMTENTMRQMFENQEVVVTEKLDGENCNLYPDHYHARSTASKDHATRHWIKGLWGSIQSEIPEGWRICGENVFAEHSIHYKSLTSYFYVFSIWDENNIALSWDDTVEVSQGLGLEIVPVLWRGLWDEDRVKSCYTGESVFKGSYDVKTKELAQEGFVCRITDALNYPQFKTNERLWLEGIGKMVRKNHVNTGEHWLFKEIKKNELKYG